MRFSYKLKFINKYKKPLARIQIVIVGEYRKDLYKNQYTYYLLLIHAFHKLYGFTLRNQVY